jgi:hypothetical protein
MKLNSKCLKKGKTKQEYGVVEINLKGVKKEAETDEYMQKILAYLLEKKEALFFGQINKDLIAKEPKNKQAEMRRRLFGRICRLELVGIVICDMQELEPYGEYQHIRHWVKNYRIAGKHIKWAERIAKKPK